MGHHQWPETHEERTDILAPVTVLVEDPPTEVIGRPRSRIRLRRTLIVAGATLGALIALYAVDLLLSSGDVPRGVTVAGVDIGGLE